MAQPKKKAKKMGEFYPKSEAMKKKKSYHLNNYNVRMYYPRSSKLKRVQKKAKNRTNVIKNIQKAFPNFRIKDVKKK